VLSYDATDSPEIASSGWTTGAIYEAAKPLFLLHDRFNSKYYVARSNAEHLPARMAHQCWTFTLPRNLQQYESDPSKWPDIVRVLRPGTKLRFVQAHNHGALDWSLYNLDLGAVIEDDPAFLVNLACVSRPSSGGTRWLRDDKWLRTL
jgi:hypothetical protein